jgi:hypothetical protein
VSWRELRASVLVVLHSCGAEKLGEQCSARLKRLISSQKVRMPFSSPPTLLVTFSSKCTLLTRDKGHFTLLINDG